MNNSPSYKYQTSRSSIIEYAKVNNLSIDSSRYFEKILFQSDITDTDFPRYIPLLNLSLDDFYIENLDIDAEHTEFITQKSLGYPDLKLLPVPQVDSLELLTPYAPEPPKSLILTEFPEIELYNSTHKIDDDAQFELDPFPDDLSLLKEMSEGFVIPSEDEQVIDELSMFQDTTLHQLDLTLSPNKTDNLKLELPILPADDLSFNIERDMYNNIASSPDIRSDDDLVDKTLSVSSESMSIVKDIMSDLEEKALPRAIKTIPATLETTQKFDSPIENADPEATNYFTIIEKSMLEKGAEEVSENLQRLDNKLLSDKFVNIDHIKEDICAIGAQQLPLPPVIGYNADDPITTLIPKFRYPEWNIPYAMFCKLDWKPFSNIPHVNWNYPLVFNDDGPDKADSEIEEFIKMGFYTPDSKDKAFGKLKYIQSSSEDFMIESYSSNKQVEDLEIANVAFEPNLVLEKSNQKNSRDGLLAVSSDTLNDSRPAKIRRINILPRSGVSSFSYNHAQSSDSSLQIGSCIRNDDLQGPTNLETRPLSSSSSDLEIIGIQDSKTKVSTPDPDISEIFVSRGNISLDSSINSELSFAKSNPFKNFSHLQDTSSEKNQPMPKSSTIIKPSNAIPTSFDLSDEELFSWSDMELDLGQQEPKVAESDEKKKQQIKVTEEQLRVGPSTNPLQNSGEGNQGLDDNSDLDLSIMELNKFVQEKSRNITKKTPNKFPTAKPPDELISFSPFFSETHTWAITGPAASNKHLQNNQPCKAHQTSIVGNNNNNDKPTIPDASTQTSKKLNYKPLSQFTSRGFQNHFSFSVNSTSLQGNTKNSFQTFQNLNDTTSNHSTNQLSHFDVLEKDNFSTLSTSLSSQKSLKDAGAGSTSLQPFIQIWSKVYPTSPTSKRTLILNIANTKLAIIRNLQQNTALCNFIECNLGKQEANLYFTEKKCMIFFTIDDITQQSFKPSDITIKALTFGQKFVNPHAKQERHPIPPVANSLALERVVKIKAISKVDMIFIAILIDDHNKPGGNSTQNNVYLPHANTLPQLSQPQIQALQRFQAALGLQHWVQTFLVYSSDTNLCNFVDNVANLYGTGHQASNSFNSTSMGLMSNTRGVAFNEKIFSGIPIKSLEFLTFCGVNPIVAATILHAVDLLEFIQMTEADMTIKFGNLLSQIQIKSLQKIFTGDWYM